MGVIKSLLLFLALTIAVSSLVFGGEINGRVTRSGDNSPLGGTTVRVEGQQVSDVSRDDGSYVLKNLPDGTYTLTATNTECWPSTMDSVATGHSADFRLLKRSYSPKNQMNLPAADNLSTEQATLELKIARKVGDHQAEYLLLNRLRVANPSDETLAKEADNAAAQLEENRATIQGSVVDSTGTAVRNAEVKVTSETGDTTLTKTNSEGQYHVTVFPVGSYKISVQHDQAVVHTGIVTSNASITKNVEIGTMPM